MVAKCLIQNQFTYDSTAVLTIIGRNDEKLPYRKAIHDYEVVVSEKIKNKEFIINNGNHTSCFVDDNLMSYILI